MWCYITADGAVMAGNGGDIMNQEIMDYIQM